MRVFHLYIDDSGCRDLAPSSEVRSDGMDQFALGGVLLDSEQVDDVFQSHKNLLQKWNMDYPLHSTEIRGRRKKFAWLGKSREKAEEFYADLENFIFSVPFVAFATVIDRQGYLDRYKQLYPSGPWWFCKTAYSILIERAVKFVQEQDGRLQIYFEKVGKKEDEALMNYNRELKQHGMPFNRATSSQYNALSPNIFKQTILGEPHERTKAVPMLQLADLVLYPIAKGGYDPTYPPYRKLLEHGKLIDSWIDPSERTSRGIKYSCFRDSKTPQPNQVALAGS